MAFSFDAIIKELAEANPTVFVETLAHVHGEPVQLINVDLSTVSTSADLAFGVGEPLRDYGYQAGQTRMDFDYEVVRLWEQPVGDLLKGPVTLLPLAVLGQLPGQQAQEVELSQVVQQLVRRLEQETTPGQLRQYLLASYILAGLRVTKPTARTIFAGVALMHESSTYQLILDEGAIRQARKAILMVGELRFGPPHESTRKTIMALEDLDQLDAMLAKIFTATTWDEVLAVPPSPST